MSNKSENYTSLNVQKPKMQNQFNAFLMSVRALTIMRIIEVNGRFNLGLLFSALRPLLLVFVVGVFIRGFNPAFTIEDAFQSVLFCGAVFFYWQEIARGYNFLDSRKNILYLPNTSHLSIILAEFCGAVFIFIPIFALSLLIFFLLEIDIDLFRLFESIVYASIFGLCYIIPASFFCFNNNIVQQLASYIPLIALFTSCVFYPLSTVPVEAKYYFLFNPLVHIIEMVRSAIFFGQDFSHVNESYIISFSIALLLTAPFAFISNIKR